MIVYSVLVGHLTFILLDQKNENEKFDKRKNIKLVCLAKKDDLKVKVFTFFPSTATNYTFVHNATSAPPISYYDYIIVGGGTAGCPLAATLSQNYSVLLLERGGSPYGNVNITNVEAFGAALSDLSPTSPSQRFISEDGVINARARVLGGGTCLNAGFYTRAAPYYVR